MIYIMIILIIIAMVIIFSINFYVKIATKKQIKIEEEAIQTEKMDCILVLGAGIWGNKPSPMLEDRLLQAISLYEKKVAPKIIMSGDHSKENYDEVNIMKQFAIAKGVPSEDIFMDHAGLSSYESVYRAKEIFGVKNLVIVTQKYHLYRALYIANNLGLKAYGVASNQREHSGQFYREVREILARDKDFVKCIFKPKPTFLGEKISIMTSGDVTNDK